MILPLERWKELATNNVNGLNSIIGKIRGIQTHIDQIQPGWKAAFDASQKNLLKQDFRREYFNYLVLPLRNAQLSYLFVQNQLTCPPWWLNFTNASTSEAQQDFTSDYTHSIRIWTFHAIALLTEDLFRILVLSESKVFTIKSENFKQIYSHVLKVSNLQHYEPLFDILRVTRNTIHNNGYFVPPNGKDVTLNYKGDVFEFKNRLQIQFADERFVLEWLPLNLAEAVSNLVTSEPVSLISFCSRDPTQFNS